jgi:alanyl-tRNA synthetase
MEKRIDGLLAQQKELEKSLKAAQQREAAGRARELAANVVEINSIPTIIYDLGAADAEVVQSVADALKGQISGFALLSGVTPTGGVTFSATVSGDYVNRVQAGKIVQAIAPIVGGKGGGKPDAARGGGKDASRLADALEKARRLIESA